MMHTATITKGQVESRPFHAQCSCGVAGDFKDKEEALAYARLHESKLGGVSTFTLVDKSTEPERLAGAVNFPSAPKVTKGVASPPPPPPPPPNKVEVKAK